MRKVEIIKDRLYWVSDSRTPRGEGLAFFFCIDEDLVYQPFFKDFGPLNLGNTYRFVTELEKLLTNKEYSTSKIIHYTSLDVAKRANMARSIEGDSPLDDDLLARPETFN